MTCDGNWSTCHEEWPLLLCQEFLLFLPNPLLVIGSITKKLGAWGSGTLPCSCEFLRHLVWYSELRVLGFLGLYRQRRENPPHGDFNLKLKTNLDLTKGLPDTLCFGSYI